MWINIKNDLINLDNVRSIEFSWDKCDEIIIYFINGLNTVLKDPDYEIYNAIAKLVSAEEVE